jgi:hypothetical protein
VEAWQWLLPAGPVSAEVERDGVRRTVAWINGTEGEAGVTMEYDFDPARADRLREVIGARLGRSLLLTSEAGHQVVGRVLELLGVGPEVAEGLPVRNLTFGGTIAAAGLLTVDDYAAAAGTVVPFSQIILPQESFDRLGLDLKGSHFSRLEQVTGISVTLA